MGCVPAKPSREEAEFNYNTYQTFDKTDRDDFDTPCGCGPWYGGSYYRELRRRDLPGYGSPPGNEYTRGGYAGRYAGDGREYLKPLPPVVPPVGLLRPRDVFVEESGPMVSMDAVPSGLVMTNSAFMVEEFPYRRRPNVVAIPPTTMW